jgi:hypothetical protein
MTSAEGKKEGDALDLRALLDSGRICKVVANGVHIGEFYQLGDSRYLMPLSKILELLKEEFGDRGHYDWCGREYGKACTCGKDKYDAIIADIEGGSE